MEVTSVQLDILLEYCVVDLPHLLVFGERKIFDDLISHCFLFWFGQSSHMFDFVLYRFFLLLLVQVIFLLRLFFLFLLFPVDLLELRSVDDVSEVSLSYYPAFLHHDDLIHCLCELDRM